MGGDRSRDIDIVVDILVDVGRFSRRYGCGRISASFYVTGETVKKNKSEGRESVFALFFCSDAYFFTTRRSLMRAFLPVRARR